MDRPLLMDLLMLLFPQYWNDFQLVWDPEDYGGISMIKISHAHVWVPDVVLFNK